MRPASSRLSTSSSPCNSVVASRRAAIRSSVAAGAERPQHLKWPELSGRASRARDAPVHVANVVGHQQGAAPILHHANRAAARLAIFG